jgi:hypothetical protein
MSTATTLLTFASLQNDTSATSDLNTNFAAINTSLANTLALNGQSPNQMQSTLDMNSNRIINLPSPSTINEPMRLADATTLNGGGTVAVSQLPIAGTVGQVLAKNSSTNFDVSWQAPNLNTVNGVSYPSNPTINQVPVVTGVNQVTYETLPLSSLAPHSANTLIGNSNNATGNLQEVSLGATLNFNAGALQTTAHTGDVTSSTNSNVMTIAPNVVTNAKAAQMAANTIKGNPTGSPANASDFTIDGLTLKGSPASADEVIIWDVAGGAIKKATVSGIGTGGAGVSSFNSLTGGVTTSVAHQTFTSPGTYTPTSGMLHCIIECWGSGGGGGGVGAATAGNWIAAGGGGAGAYSRKYATAAAVGASQVITVPAGGNGGAAGNNAGSNGVQTSFGSLCVAAGGTGGNGNAATGAANGGAGGSGGTGDLVTPGQSGFCFPTSPGGATTTGCTSPGGSSSVGSGGQQLIGTNGVATAGAAGAGYGAGGAGATACSGGISAAGGAGAPGLCIVTEFVNL